MNTVAENGRRMTPTQNALIFGATGHIGAPAARHIEESAPHVRLRLATHRQESVAGLEKSHPNAEIVVADYLDGASLAAATDGFDTVFILTPDFIDEQAAMTNMVAAIKGGTPRHLIRITGDPPHVHRPEQVSPELNAWGGGTAVQHLRARAILEDSGLPVTFVNISAYYMDNFLRLLAVPLKSQRTLFMPYDRHMNYVDAADVGLVVAKLLLSDDRYHFGKTYHLDNGVDCLTFTDVAEMMSDVFGEQINYDDDVERFLSACRPSFDASYGQGVLDYMLAYCRWEQQSDPIWRRTDVLTSQFGIKPRLLRDWLADNRSALLG